MSKYIFDSEKVVRELISYFDTNQKKMTTFGSSVNQVFESYIVAHTTKWYKKKNWNVELINPEGISGIKLKFSTRGRPSNYSYFKCSKNGKAVQIRHQLRVCTKHYRKSNAKNANIVCDVAVIDDIDLSKYKTYHAVPNYNLKSFIEVKHMSAFAELVASFIGIVHELIPIRLDYIKDSECRMHINPSLFISGINYSTAEGIIETIKRRKMQIKVVNYIDIK